MIHVGLPQGIYLVLILISLSVYAANDGRPLPDPNYRFGSRALGAILGFGLLYWGGFFS